MRTATPLVTWSMMTEYGPSATALAISRPRLSGPGCRMMTCGLASLTASSVRQKYCAYSSSVGKKLAPCRSRWIRSIMMTSASRTPSARSVWSSAPNAASARDERRRPDQPHGGAERPQAVQVRARHAAVQHVADDRHREPLEAAEVLADRQQVEEGLRRVLVAADVSREQVAGPRGGMADHDRVGAHGLEVPRRVGQRLALAGARGRGRDVHRVGRQPLSGDLERGAGPRARLVEEIDDGLAAERGHLLDVALRDLLEGRGRIEDARDLPRRDALQPEQVPLRERHAHLLTLRSRPRPRRPTRRAGPAPARGARWV